MLGHDHTTRLRPGQEVRVGRSTIRHGGLDVRHTDRFDEVGVRLGVTSRSTDAASLRPSRRSYRARGMATTETAMLSTLREDLLIAVRSADAATGAVVLEVFTRPLMVLVWWGGVLVLTGGVLTLSQRENGRRRPEPAVRESLGRVVEPYVRAPQQ